MDSNFSYDSEKDEMILNFPQILEELEGVETKYKSYFAAGGKNFNTAFISVLLNELIKDGKLEDAREKLETADEKIAWFRKMASKISVILTESGLTILDEKSKAFTRTMARFVQDSQSISVVANKPISIADALGKMTVTSEMVAAISDNIESFRDMGVTDSHRLRAKLHAMADKDKLSGDALFLVYFLAAQMKNKDRVERASEQFPSALLNYAPMRTALNFIKNRLVQYVKDETAENFAMVHLPNTNPGLDILCSILVVPTASRDPSIITARQTFAQISLDSTLQAENKDSQRKFWEEVITSTRNQKNAGFKKGFNEDFYKTSAGDDYKLVTFNDSYVLQEVLPANGKNYVKDDIVAYLAAAPSWA